MRGPLFITDITTHRSRFLPALLLLLLGWGSARSQTVVTTQDGFVFRGKIIARD